MNHRKPIAFLAVLAGAAVVLTVSCGGGSAGSPDSSSGGSPDASLDDASPGDDGSSGTVGASGPAAGYCNATFGAFVGYLGNCCTTADKATAGFGLLDGLLAAGQAACSQALDSGLSKGRLSADQGQLASCTGAVSQALPSTCGQAVNTSTIDVNACKSVFHGTVAAGAACAGDQECVDGLTCVGWSAGVDGVCKTPPAIGEACGKGQPDAGGSLQLTANFSFGTHPGCAPGAYCAFGKCAAQVADGQSCLADTKDECASGHCFEGKCGLTAPSGQGGPCAAKADCTSGLYCDRPGAASTGACQPQKAASSTCTNQANECKGNCTAGKCVAFCGSG